MHTKSPNFLWRKSVAADWLERFGHELDRETGGSHALIERPGGRRIRIEMFCDRVSAARRLAKAFGGFIVELPRDWESSLNQPAPPRRIGRRLRIFSDENDCEAGAGKIARLVIPAGSAFGTGAHATTAMSLRMLERVSRRLPRGWRMLDAGAGSGILALAGRRFGADTVLAIDNDPRAIRTAKANARRNGIRGVEFRVGEITQLDDGAFHIIAANLYAELLVSLLPRFRTSLAADGCLILSGVLRTQERRLRAALRSNHFNAAEVRRRGKWIAALCSGSL